MPNPVLPVVGFLMKVGLGKAAAFAVASFAVNTAGTLAVNAAIGALTRKRAGAQERQAQVSTLSMGEVPREAVFGITAIGGSLVDVFNHGGAHGTDKVTFCIALADHACDGMQGYFVNDEYRSWTGDGPQAAFGGKLILEFRNAREDGWAPPADAVAHGGWTATDRGCGVTHMWVTVEYDEKVWPQGLPRFRWEVRGLHPFDPRRHDHDPDDPTTWTFSRSPILQRYTWARGIYATGRHGQPEHLLIGRGLTADEAPPARIIGAANICDEPIDGLLRYFCDGAISADLDFIEVEEMFATSVAGTIVQREGGVEIEPGHAKATVVTITDDDLVVGEPVEYSAFRPDSDGGRVNTVIPRYVSVAQRYTDHSGPVRRDLADIAKDGGPREMTLVLPLVSNGAVADRNAEIARRLARLERRASIVLPPEFSRLEEGDWIAWRSDRFFGGATVRFRIEAWALDAAWRMRLNLREIAASVYGEPDPLDDPVPPPPPPTPPDALSLTNVTVEAITLAGDAVTSTVPALRFRWGDRDPDTGAVIVDPAVRAIRAEVRRNTAAPGQPALWTQAPTQTDDVLAGWLVTTNGVGPNQSLQGRLVPIGEPSRPVMPSPWVSVTTGDAVSTDTHYWGGRPSTDFVAIINNLNRLLTQIQQGANDQEARLRRHIDGVLGRVQIIAGVDPVAGSGVFHLQNLTAIDGLTLLETFDGLFVADEAAMAAVALEQYGRIAGDAAEAGARLAAITDLEGQIAYSGLELRNYVDAEIVSATAGLATLTYVDDTVALSALNLRSDITAEIASSTAGLVSSATLASNMALAALDAQARVDAYASTASGLFATTAAFNGLSSTVGVHATAIAGLQARAYLDLVADASGGLPALVRLMSGDGLSEVALIAARLIFGTTDGSTVVEAMRIIAGVVTILNRLNIGDENFFIDAPTKTIQAVVDDARLVFGAPFGVDRRVLWFGDKTIALSAMSAANSQFGMGGNVVVTLPPGTGTGGNGSFSGEASLSGALSGSGWQTAKSFTLNSVRAGSISVAVSTVGSETVGGANWTGQVRLREAGGAVVAGPESIVVANLTEDPASTASFVGTVSAGGTVTYELQFSKSSGADVAALRGGVAVTTTPLLT